MYSPYFCWTYLWQYYVFSKKQSFSRRHHQHYQHHTTATNPETSKSLSKERSPGYQHVPHLQTAGRDQAVKILRPPVDGFLPPLFSCRAFSQGQGLGCRKMNCSGIISQLWGPLSFPQGLCCLSLSHGLLHIHYMNKIQVSTVKWWVKSTGWSWDRNMFSQKRMGIAAI